LGGACIIEVGATAGTEILNGFLSAIMKKMLRRKDLLFLKTMKSTA